MLVPGKSADFVLAPQPLRIAGVEVEVLGAFFASVPHNGGDAGRVLLKETCDIVHNAIGNQPTVVNFVMLGDLFSCIHPVTPERLRGRWVR